MHLQIQREESDMTWLTAKFCVLLWLFVWLPLWCFSFVKYINQPGGTCFGSVFVGCCDNSESSFGTNDSSGAAMCGRELAVPLLLGRIKGRKLREGWAQDSPFLAWGGCLEPPAWGALRGSQLWILMVPRAFRQLESQIHLILNRGGLQGVSPQVCGFRRGKGSWCRWALRSETRWGVTREEVSGHCPTQGP